MSVSRVRIDFAGPLLMQETYWNCLSYKVYLAVFIVFTVEATNLEVVTIPFTAAFQGTFDYFVVQRGLESDIHTDCGTHFDWE